MRLVLPALFLLLLCACTPSATVGGIAGRLSNRGPVALSDENPYLAGNLFLSQRAAQSAVLRGFLKYRGVPPAIEIEKNFMGAPQVRLYYPEQREIYVLEEAGDEAVISGPQHMNQAKQDQLLKLTSHLNKAPVLLPEEQRAIEAAPGGAQAVPSSPAPPPPPAARRAVAAPPPPHERPASTPRPPAAAPQDAERQELVSELQHETSNETLAELTPRGDLVHYVTFDGETLSMIALWYTHDRANVGRLTRLNKLKHPDSLKVGDVIVIPSYLVQNRVKLTERAVQQLKVKR